MGSYEVRDLTNIGAGKLFEGKVVYDKSYGHVAYGCASCCGYSGLWLYYDPLGLPKGALVPNYLEAVDQCNGLADDVSYAFFGNWNTGSTAIATVDYSGTHTGVSVGSTTSLTSGLLQTFYPKLDCPIMRQTPSGNVDVTPMVGIGPLSHNPILAGTSATTLITIDPPAPVTLTMTRSGTGDARFSDLTTSIDLTQTTTVSVRGLAASQSGSLDLKLSAISAGTTVDSMNFSVSSGACTLTNTGGIPPAPDGGCPKDLTIIDKYNISDYCDACSFECGAVGYDSSFYQTNCLAVNSGFIGSGNRSLTSTLKGNFHATDCNRHTLTIRTSVINAQGIRTDRDGGSFDLKCGSPTCAP